MVENVNNTDWRSGTYVMPSSTEGEVQELAIGPDRPEAAAANIPPHRIPDITRPNEIDRGFMSPESYRTVLGAVRRTASPDSNYTWKMGDLVTFGGMLESVLVPIVDKRGMGAIAGYQVVDIATGHTQRHFRPQLEESTALGSKL